MPRREHHEIDDKARALVIRLRGLGVTWTAIQERTGLSRASISDILRAAGITNAKGPQRAPERLCSDG